jgi:hypothetical protein
VTALTAVCLATTAARADVFTFAQFTQQDVGQNLFSYQNPTTTGTGSANFLTLVGAPVFAQATNANAFTTGFPTGPLSALLVLSASTAQPATQNPDKSLQEAFPGTTNKLTITLDTAVNGKTNFLTATFSAKAAGLTGPAPGSSTGGFSGSDAATDTVQFSSDFIDFTGSKEHSFALSFSSITSTLGGLQQDPNGFYDSFAAAGTGTFDTVFAVPEPGSLLLAGVGVLGLAGLGLSRWRSRQAT